jgi:hypothetical protein
MRFVFVARVVELVPLRRIETLMRVSVFEDVFADHFPGYPGAAGRARRGSVRAGRAVRRPGAPAPGAPVEIAANE